MQNTTMLDSTVSNSMQLFQNAGFKVRVIIRLGNPWFVASDACDGLALSNVSEALSDLDDDDKLKLTKDEIDTLISNEGIKCSVDARVQSLVFVSESGMYDLVMMSRKSENTITNHVEALVKRGAVTVTKFLVTVKTKKTSSIRSDTRGFLVAVAKFFVTPIKQAFQFL